ncbi:MAG: bifunctional nuclease family protein [Cytophagales bacterium]|nr:bifunctional nuclease family protein [Bernardetiaceae bacterium]MDW8204571.1 bifunctional nuclease family protein [Cytophagales bacterium]
MEKIKLEILGLSSSQSQSGSFALVLGEVGKKRRLPIIIGMFEAQAIAIEIEKITSARPMTHDLFKSFAKAFHYDIHEIIISELREGVFYAKIVCSSNNSYERVEIDARPSDAIAIGLRFNVPIYTYEDVLSEAGITISDMEEEDDEMQATSSRSSRERSSERRSPMAGGFASMTTEQLENELQRAIEEEDYERAAKIRDELNKRK